MRILVSNDDGYSAPGLEALVASLRGLGELTVVAPESNHSGASNSLTLSRPLTVRTASNGFMVVNGTPFDCVHVALTGLMGDHTLYAGTVAATSEAYLFGVPAMGFSLVEKDWEYIESAARVVRQLVERQLAHPLTAPVLLNVNIPSRRFDDIQGLEVTRLGKRHPSQPVVRSATPYSDTVYWIGPVGSAADATPGTDFHDISQGAVSITPLRLDLTQHSQLDSTRDWASDL